MSSNDLMIKETNKIKRIPEKVKINLLLEQKTESVSLSF